MEQARKQQVPKETITSSDTATLKEFDQKTTLFNTMTKSKSFNKSLKHRALYHALMESILENEDALDKCVADEFKKRRPDDADKDEGRFVVSDQGITRQRISKGTETLKKTSATKEYSKVKSPATSSKSSKSGKSAKDQVVEPIFVQDSNNTEYDDAGYADMPMDQGEDLGKSVDDGPEQSWLNDMAKATKPPLTFNELMHTLIDFSTFAMNRLKIDNLTKEIFIGPSYNLLKGTCKSYVDNDKKYTASTTKYKAARYELKGIEDMVPNLWNPINVVYDRYALLGISH
ncbi:hypothetical protein Tco_0641909 [Tanacetum coccineum]